MRDYRKDERTLTREMLQLLWAWKTRRGSAEGSNAGGEGGFRPISGQKEQVRHRDSGASALLLGRLMVSRCSAIFISAIKQLQSRLQQGRGQNRPDSLHTGGVAGGPRALCGCPGASGG